MKNSKMFIAGFVLLLPAFVAAQNQSPAGNKPAATAASDNMTAEQSTGNSGRPCTPDMEKFCEDVATGAPMEQFTCLNQHKADLSAPCKKRMAEAAKLIEDATTKYQKEHPAKARKKTKVNNPCMADTEKFCGDVEGGPRKKAKCLKEHSADLSQACKDKLARDRAKAKKKKDTKPADQK